MHKKIRNPLPPDNVARPTPPPNPPRPPSWQDDIDEIRRLRDALEQATRWIPVSERLPEPHIHFLALNRNGYVFESAMCYGMHEPWFTYPRGDGNASNTAPDWIDVTHWMPKGAQP
ncbi:hypothetical protein LCGC14_2248420 [marine sediment metagenome]|uniref:DUF551 domain-containing protein n=1 Tax=marine sediment metagenome TaxID=412755 RepID=A0A0F9FFU7_9ZZZZ